MRKVVEGSAAVAEAIKACRAQVISAYPITPQTHIVQELSEMVANGELNAEFIKVESEHSAASAALGASAVGARAYTASSSQGIMLMAEVLFNIAGMRFPIVMTTANRAISAPINIWNDQQDSMSVRDAGWIQLYAEDNQEAVDLHVQAYRIAEDSRVQLPVMVCMDGFVLTHSYEPVDIPEQALVDRFLPPYNPANKLDPSNPRTFGTYAEEGYSETR
ncbi:MAG TPA: pyruvate ferredoxin oxidoreductase, partial [Chloroflexota bacterium]